MKKEEKKVLRYIDFEAFLKAWSQYLRLQEDLESLRNLCPDPADQEAVRRIEIELLEISKRAFRRLKAQRGPW